MIGYTMVGSNDIARASAFYDALFEQAGIGQLFKTDRFVAWGNEPGAPMFCVCVPYDGEAATAGNGTMIAIKLADQQTVNALHAKALALGGSNEGDPGLRMETFYCSYIRDLDGNKLNLFVPAD